MRIPQWFLLVWVIAVTLIAIAGAMFAYTFVRDRAGELDEVLALPDPPQVGRPLAGVDPTMTPHPATGTPTVAEPLQTDATPPATDATGDDGTSPAAVATPADELPPLWDDPRRVSVLLMGIDQREGEEGTFPTDTLILFSLDPVGKTAAILSIPRDLWVTYPGLNRSGRINGANIIGDDINYPGGGGPAFAVRTVENVLGVNIPYYVLINFEVFYTFIDAIGPIEVCPENEIHDEQYPDGSYGYMTVHFDPGCQELDSERLLQYARTRHGDTDSDIGRSRRQQEVILKVRQKVLSVGGVSALLPQAPGLWESVQDNIKTNLTFEKMVSLARTAEQISEANIRQGQISFGEVYIGTSPEGDEILIPIATDIRLLIEDLFRPPGAPSARSS